MRACLSVLLLSACGTPVEATPHPCAGEAHPQTIEAFVEHVNTLPRPVTTACLLRSLQRPLHLVATDNESSAQPADGSANPRIFVFADDFTLSVVPDGPGADVWEFGQHTDPTHTRKGELAAPITATVDPADPHDKILDPNYGTICAVCHIEQTEHPDGGFTSIALATPSNHRIDLADVRAEAATCTDPRSDRCQTLHALFAGEVVETDFPDDYPTLSEL